MHIAVTYRLESSTPVGCLLSSVSVDVQFRRTLTNNRAGLLLHDKGGGSSGQVEGSNNLVVELHDDEQGQVE